MSDSPYRIYVKDSIHEEYFADIAEARARHAVLAKDRNAEAPLVSHVQNHEWMQPGEHWYCVRWIANRGVRLAQTPKEDPK